MSFDKNTIYTLEEAKTGLEKAVKHIEWCKEQVDYAKRTRRPTFVVRTMRFQHKQAKEEAAKWKALVESLEKI